MKNQSQGSVIGYPVVHESIVAYSRPTEYVTAHLKQKRLESIIDLMNKFRRKADNLAQGIRDHVSLGPGVSETVKGKLKLGTRILQAGGIERVFMKSFSIIHVEKLIKAFQCHLSTTAGLIKAFQCHLSTTAGPIPGLLFMSTEKIAFISDRSLVVRSPKGYVANIPYKVLIPLRRIQDANPSENSNEPNQKYIQIETIDDFEFWFMGFVCYQRSLEKGCIPWEGMHPLGRGVSLERSPINMCVGLEESVRGCNWSGVELYWPVFISPHHE